MVLCWKSIVLPPHASRSDVCGKQTGHASAGDPVHLGDRRGVEWIDTEDGPVCGAALADAPTGACGLHIPCPTHHVQD